MAPSKRPDVFIEALSILAKRGVDFTASLYGDPAPDDKSYYGRLTSRIKELGLPSRVQFYGAVRHGETPAIYSAHEICVNLSPSGMYDKTIFEAAACGSLSLTSNQNLTNFVNEKLLFKEGGAEDLAQKLESLLKEREAEKQTLRTQLQKLVAGHHSLPLLGNELARSLRPRRAVLFQNGSIGDFLMFVHLSELLMENGRFSDVTIVVPRNAAFLRGLVGAYPYLSVLEISSRRWGAVSNLWAGTKTVLTHPTIGKIPLRVKFLAWLLSRGKGSELIGFQDVGPLCWLYSRTLTYDTNKPYIDTIRSLARTAGAREDTETPYLRFEDPQEQKVLAVYGIERKKYIMFHPGASNPKRMFTVGDAVELVRFISEKFPDMRIVLSGGQDERQFIERVVHLSGGDIIVAIGTDAPTIAALIRHTRLFIGTDTGITHLACFLGTRVVEVAHHATMNWLAFYAPSATVLYRLAGEDAVHTEQSYLKERAAGQLRPFTAVPVTVVRETIGAVLQ